MARDTIIGMSILKVGFFLKLLGLLVPLCPFSILQGEGNLNSLNFCLILKTKVVGDLLLPVFAFVLILSTAFLNFRSVFVFSTV